jgi:acetoin utilization protein AcuB
MLVKDCMKRHPIMISPLTPASEAEQIMVENKIRHLPVTGEGKSLQGLITRQRLSLKPTDMGSLNVWEITRLLSNLKVKDIMIKKDQVITITGDKTIERAAKVMTENQIGCLPIVEDDQKTIVGILTETDLLLAFQAILGLPSSGVRVTMRMPDKEGQFNKLSTVLAQNGWGVMGIGSFPSPRHPGYYDVVIKIPRRTVEEVQNVLSQVEGQEIADIREGF